MQTVSKRAAAILNTLTADMEVGQSRQIGAKGDTYMPVHVGRLTENRFSVAHYFEQNGDLMSDPDIEYHRFETGDWAPVNHTLSSLGVFRRALEFNDAGEVTGIWRRTLKDLCSFTTVWMSNIKSQQDGLKNIPAAS
jgi:hypothetical protein